MGRAPFWKISSIIVVVVVVVVILVVVVVVVVVIADNANSSEKKTYIDEWKGGGGVELAPAAPPLYLPLKGVLKFRKFQKNLCEGVSLYLPLQPCSPEFLNSLNTGSQKNVFFECSEIVGSLIEKGL